MASCGDGLDEDDANKEACVIDGFTEYETVIDLIEKLPHLPSSDEDRVVERACEKFQVIFNKYIEQPHLIDSKLDIFLNKIIDQLRNPEFDIDVKHRIFKFLFIITNVRGYKFIVERLPHEVEDLDPVLKMLEEQDPSDTNRWETRYGLILWLSIIVKLPFNISRFDSGDSHGEFTNTHGVMDRLLNVVQTYLNCSDACHRVAAYLNARLLTRTDVKEPHLEAFIYWVIEMIDSQLMTCSWNKFGLLSGLADVLKLGERTDLLPHAHRISECIQKYNCLKNYPLTDKLVMKIVTRVGLLFLKPRVNTWQYKKECMNLAINLKPGPQKVLPKYKDQEETSDSSSEDEDELDLDDDSLERVESIIQQLIKGLQNRFFQARLSASKGIARIVNRLDKQMGDQVICYVLDLLSPRMCDDAWHGGCMALAEIVRRGLLLPARIPEVVNLVVKALDYEKPHGATSVGDNVRDSAAYVCWGLARAYSIKLMEAHSSTLARALLIVACYDREIHCRRSAAAAYQECVGRLGVFPHGIDIVSTADYFSLGSRSNAYLKVSVHIAQYREYTRPFISHLMEKKLNNWDPNIRSLASKALHLLTAKDPQYLADSVVPQLIEQALSVEFNPRHGALLGLGEIINALSLIPAVTISLHFIDELETMIISVYRKITVSSNDLMLAACCHFIEKCSPAKLPFRGTTVFTEWQWVLDTCIVAKNPDVRLAAALALKELCIARYYYRQDEQVCYSLLTRLNLGLKVDERQMMGCALALGHLPTFMVQIHLPGVIAALIGSLEITKRTLKWAKGRSVAIKALASICISTGLDKNDGNSCYFVFVQIVLALLDAMDDYTISNQGDVGALTREAAMKGLQALLILATDQDAIELLSPGIVTDVVVKVVQQGVERIDRVRNIAGNVFCNLLYKEDKQIPYFPARKTVEEIFTPKICESCFWANANNCMPLFVQLMKLPSYTKPLLLGLISSIGGVLESLANCASDITFNYLREQTTDEQKRIVEIVAEIFEENIQNDRIAVPILHFLELYFGSGCLLSLIQDPQNTLAMRILDTAKKTVTKTGNSKKLAASVGLFCELLKVGGDVARRSFVQLGIFLCHKFMWLRRVTAEKLTETLIVHYSECGFTPELEEQVIEMTSETEWEMLTTDKARESRNALLQLLNLPLPCKISDRSADKTMSGK